MALARSSLSSPGAGEWPTPAIGPVEGSLRVWGGSKTLLADANDRAKNKRRTIIVIESSLASRIGCHQSQLTREYVNNSPRKK
jgi:hypothetical protein